MSDLTPGQVHEMEQALTRHYGEPVMPVSRYCAAFDTWWSALEHTEEPGLKKIRESAVLNLPLAIAKSNLLWRLIYLGEPLRTRQCPVHRGRWSGYGDCACNLGGTFSDRTGWLPA